jgi:hypothetical protein
MTASYYVFSGALASPCLKSKRLLAPWGFRRRTVVLTATYTMAAAITTTMRVVCSVHYYTAHGWPDTFVPAASCFTNFNVLVLLIANYTYRCHAL